MSVHDILIMVEVAIVLGIAGYVLADRLRLPAIVLLMLLGILAGPEVLNIINPLALGDGLRILVSIAVGIIVFEGGMLLDFGEMRAATPAIRNLITIGVALSVVLGTLVAWQVAGLPFQLALLFGALMCVTGPTVVTPLLKRANVSRRLTAVLQSEAVLVDAIGAVLAVVVLEVIVHPPEAVISAGVRGVATRLGIGTLVGLVGGYLIVVALRRLRALPSGTVRLAALGGALGVFAGAEALAPEAGIAAVALAGIVVGNYEIPYKEEIENFKGDLTNLSIILLFVLLAAGLRFETFIDFNLGGLGGVLTVILLMVLVRPVSVFLATIGTRLRFKERLYIAALGPRGVVAAAIALYAELELTQGGIEDGVSSFTGLVFMTIIGTVVIEGLLATPLARRLGVTAMQILVVSADDIGRELARRLITNGMSVTLLDTDVIHVNLAREMGLNALQGDATSVNELRKADIEQAATVVAATPSDKVNLLVCQIAMQRFGKKDIVARVNNPENLDNFSSLGIRVMSPAVSTAILLDALVRQSAVMELIASQVPDQDVCEIKMTNQKLSGKPLNAWNLRGDVLVGLVRRNGKLFVPDGDTVIQEGDILTLIGSCDDVEDVRDMVE